MIREVRDEAKETAREVKEIDWGAEVKSELSGARKTLSAALATGARAVDAEADAILHNLKHAILHTRVHNPSAYVIKAVSNAQEHAISTMLASEALAAQRNECAQPPRTREPPKTDVEPPASAPTRREREAWSPPPSRRGFQPLTVRPRSTSTTMRLPSMRIPSACL